MILHFEWELELIRWLQGLETSHKIIYKALLDFSSFSSFLAEDFVLIIAVAIVYWCINKRLGEYMAFTAMFSIALNNILKSIFLQKRPFDVDPEIKNLRWKTATGKSFPSGHTQSAATVSTSLYLAIRKKYLLWVAIIATLCVAFSRIFLGAHFVTDVIVGGTVGTLTAIFMYYFYNRFEERKFLVYLTFLAFLIPVAFFLNNKDFYVGFGLYSGFVLGIFVENRYVNFTSDVPLWEKAVRLILGCAIVFGIKEGLKGLFELIFQRNPDELNILTFIRYMMISFVAIGAYPLTFKYLHHLKRLFVRKTNKEEQA